MESWKKELRAYKSSYVELYTSKDSRECKPLIVVRTAVFFMFYRTKLHK